MAKMPFAWKDRDTAAQDLLQLVYHGPERVRNGALVALQAIRSPIIASELKTIALDVGWSFEDRANALKALAAIPGDLYMPALAEVLAPYLSGRSGILIEDGNTSSVDPVVDDQLSAEKHMVHASFTFVGRQSSNEPWFFDLLERGVPRLQCAVLCAAIGYTCKEPLEAKLIDRLIMLLEQHPELLTLEIAEVIANHSEVEPIKYLIDNVEKIIALCLNEPSWAPGLLGFSPSLTAKVAETHPELAQLSPLYTYLFATADVMPYTVRLDPYLESPVWQQLTHLYERAQAGDMEAFQKLYDLPEEEHASIPIRAAATHFLGKLWEREPVLERLCLLMRDAEETWGLYGFDMPVRFEAAEALKATTSPRAWDALINLVFLQTRPFEIERVIEWLTHLTDVLSNTVPSPEINWGASRWFDALTEENGDLDILLGAKSAGSMECAQVSDQPI